MSSSSDEQSPGDSYTLQPGKFDPAKPIDFSFFQSMVEEYLQIFQKEQPQLFDRLGPPPTFVPPADSDSNIDLAADSDEMDGDDLDLDK
ncbi:hypothetical protein P9112_009977 [Eukaryota sp. TZLM1-RC]